MGRTPQYPTPAEAAPMIVSEARIAANRANAQKSTGPKTPEGKQRSRANALKHGLCASAVVPETLEQVQERSALWYRAIRPQDDAQAWLVDRVAVLSIRIDRCERMERRARDKVALRAELSWDDDRRLEAEALGVQLGRRPGRQVEGLRRTPQGCDWLMTRWAMLAHVADVKGSWTPEQTQLAFDLLGTPAEFRDGHRPGVSLDREGRLVDPGDDPAAVARREIAALVERRAVVADLDEVERALAEADLSDGPDPELKRLRRYESTLHRRLRWCLDQVRRAPKHEYRADIQPRWSTSLEPEAVPEAPPEPGRPRDSHGTPEPHPPFDLEPHECPAPGARVDIPAILGSRRARRAEKAESRREARRRKLDRLRG